MPIDIDRQLQDLLRTAEAFRAATIQSGALTKVPQNEYIEQLRALECALQPQNYRTAEDAPASILRKALERIERWFGEFPDTGRTWPDGSPMSYIALYGSNGERDFMREIAREALAAVPLPAQHPILWVCLVDDPIAGEKRLRAWTTKRDRAQRFIAEGLDMQPLYAAVLNSDVYEQHDLIEKLREPEGATVSLFCDNPEPETPARNNAIEINDDWTNWKPRRFEGENLVEALRSARAARDACRAIVQAVCEERSEK